MDAFTLILYVVGAVVLSSFLSRFIPRISTPLVQIALGALMAQLPFFPNITLDPDLFMVLFIAPLLYLEAHEIDKSALLKTLNLSLSLAIGLALMTMVTIGFVLHTMWPVIPLAAAFALGAALGPTDAVAVSSISSEASLTNRQRSVLEGESLFNDASGVVGFQFSILAAVTGSFSLAHATGEFLISFIGGTFFGLLLGVLANWLFETLRSVGWETTTTRILMEIFLPFLIYLGADDIAHVSGVLAVVAAGLVIHFDRTGVGPNVARTNIVSGSVWSVLSFSLNGAVFILLGFQLPKALSTSWTHHAVSHAMLIEIIVLVCLVVIGLRFAWVSLVAWLSKDQETGLRRTMTANRWRSAAVMTFGGPKGTITLSLMFTIPYVISSGAAFPLRDELIFVSSGAIITTLVLANFMLPLLAPNRSDDESTEMMEITIEAVRRTVEELTKRVTPENRRAVLQVIDSYTKRISRLKQRIGQGDPRKMEQLQVAALHWEKDYIVEQLDKAKAGTQGDPHERELRIEACERMLDQIMNSLRHVSTDHPSGRTVSQIRGRIRAMQRRALILTRRVNAKIRRTTPLVSENEVHIHMRDLQLNALEYVIDHLYDEMGQNPDDTEYCSALILDYRRAEAALRARPSVAVSTKLLTQIDEAKHESYAIELGIIRDMVESGEVSRAQAKHLRRNVYVMQVDADSEL
ncbi:cation:proton antiporter [Bifidobacterium tibiigranuli]|jgi:CPA1 family monovalent cation:H+ antiporter|uniref:cation:proton antiporter n=2 Tax=Bifidobacterium tibiigranuli TaxID=2172043 RepID=UPI0026E9EE51|nr:sodium:proton antiporter [Bifidobacterium tibiigranuli]MCI1714155.1 sodium:proton antiporter [Bifidobacterium tibiigranuli]MCI1834136.1 sodium:proton antiporter [Bifidobacterium tibiigranuli]